MAPGRELLRRVPGVLVLLVAVVALIASLAGLRVLAPAENDARTGVAIEPTPTLPPLPVCSETGTSTTEIEVTVEGSLVQFPSSCYYAPAGEALQIIFTNHIKALNRDAWTTDNISIYASQSDAVQIIDGGLMTGFALESAVFVGQPITGPASISYDIPPLAAGTYYMQSDRHAGRLFALLIVTS